jgi:hypothetical protein
MIMRILLLLTITFVVSLPAQTIYSQRIKGMRIDGMGEAKFPVVLLDSLPVTISFDVDGTKPENFHVKIFHCDKDWNITRSSFINDEFRNFSKNQISFEEAPVGVRTYRWTYTLRIPEGGDKNNTQSLHISGMNDFEKLPQSGNYKFEVWNDDQNELVAEGKFFAAEKVEDSALTVYNRYLPSETSPQNQVNKAVLSFTVPPPQVNDASPIYSTSIKIVDVYRNREIEFPHRIDTDDRNPNTFIDGYGTNNLKFVIDNLQPGNEYRRLDEQTVDLYSLAEVLRKKDGADLSRWMFQGHGDQNGISTPVAGNRYADYIQFQFELGRPEENSNEKIYVVGDFNGWKVDEQWRLHYDEATKHYKLLALLRRGTYDYQYILNGNDWITLEGNDWRTVNVYTALLYYHDPRFGGFDRILLAAQAKSPGGLKANSQ